jgi:hypothetical protein
MPTVNISTPAQLYNLMTGVSLLTDDYALQNNIDMTGYIAESIGNTDPTNGFQGSFDGQGYTVFIYDISSNYNGFFSECNGTGNIIENLTVHFNSTGKTFNIPGLTSMGGLVGESTVSIINCHVICNDSYTLGSGTNISVGGFIGTIGSTSPFIRIDVSGCSLTAGNNFTVNSVNFCAFFIAQINSVYITNCSSNIGNLSSLNGGAVGFLCGDLGNCTNTYVTIGNNCTVNVSSGGYFGGIGSQEEFTSTIPSNIYIIVGDNLAVTGQYGGSEAGV